MVAEGEQEAAVVADEGGKGMQTAEEGGDEVMGEDAGGEGKDWGGHLRNSSEEEGERTCCDGCGG